jgi:hypothetical protein
MADCGQSCMGRQFEITPHVIQPLIVRRHAACHPGDELKALVGVRLIEKHEIRLADKKIGGNLTIGVIGRASVCVFPNTHIFMIVKRADLICCRRRITKQLKAIQCRPGKPFNHFEGVQKPAVLH